jgi:alanyl-tRNA synthetase
VSSAPTSFEAVVTDIRLESRVEGVARWQIALDRTLFSTVAPTGVLEAVARSGARLAVPVLGVVEEGSVVWHVADKPLTEGTGVTGKLGE